MRDLDCGAVMGFLIAVGMGVIDDVRSTDVASPIVRQKQIGRRKVY